MPIPPIEQPIAQVEQPSPQNNQKPLLLWPGVVAVVLQWAGWFVVPIVAPAAMLYGMLAGLICGLAVVVWWLFFSRAMWLERVGIILLMILAVVVTKRLVHPSIAGGMMGMMLPVYAIPILCLALVAAAAASRRLGSWPRRAVMIAAIVLACGAFTLLRTGGITAEATSDLHWRWTKTPEERLLAHAADEPALPPTNASTAGSPTTGGATTDSGWPGFRGSNRDDVIRGVRIETDWSKSPPVELWRQPVGPGWSSFAVRDKLFYTQEQRGNDEVVSCYNLATGKAVWRHRDATRFYESNAGAGPRGTPTLSNGRVYSLGATGLLNALDSSNGAVIWSRNAGNDTKTKIPAWGFASSPLVVGDVVIVATAGVLAAYDIVNGNPRWFGPSGGRGYSSPHLLTIGGVAQVLLLNGEGAISVNPADGTLLWKHAWEGDSIVQPAITADGDVLIGSGSGLGSEVGVLRVAVAHESGGWTTKQRWISEGLKPYFNDFVIHKNFAFGFDGSNLACIDLNNGERKWKGARYGNGQLVLLPDQDLLLVMSEEGEVALVKAVPEQFTELSRFKALQSKTWNHPVVVGDTLLVRNAEEMAAFRMATAGR